MIPRLGEAGHRVIAPYLRGHGPTRFRDLATPRSGQQAAIGSDVIALLDALAIPRAIFAGYDWGGRAACVAAALWPERCAGIVSVNSYLIQEVSLAMTPDRHFDDATLERAAVANASGTPKSLIVIWLAVGVRMLRASRSGKSRR